MLLAPIFGVPGVPVALGLNGKKFVDCVIGHLEMDEQI
jgi:hypothetical protein